MSTISFSELLLNIFTFKMVKEIFINLFLILIFMISLLLHLLHRMKFMYNFSFKLMHTRFFSLFKFSKNNFQISIIKTEVIVQDYFFAKRIDLNTFKQSFRNVYCSLRKNKLLIKWSINIISVKFVVDKDCFQETKKMHFYF